MKKVIWVILILGVLIGGWFGYKFFRPVVENKENKFFYINVGDDVRKVKENLVKNQFIAGADFDLVSKMLKYKTPKPGRYKLKNGLSMYRLIKHLRGGNQVEVKLVINKERTRELFAGKFGPNKKFDTAIDSIGMIAFMNNNDSLIKFGVDTNTVMSIVMPYTYNINWTAGPGKIFRQFHSAYEKFWTEDRKVRANAINLTQLEVISLASIVEEETNKKADKYNIASTYLNRVRAGMKLQADPTVKFSMKNFALKRVLGVHLKTDSPYNTYMYAGIPPGPICTPTPETIDAVLDAPVTEYLYFVASHKFDGTSIFTTNYNDHLKYARLYQDELTRRMDSSKKANANR